MFGFGKSRSAKSAALVLQQQNRNDQENPEVASLERVDLKEHRDFSVLESIDGEGTVLIGKGTSVVGEIANCSKVEIQGHLEGSIVAGSVVVREGGSIKGGLHAGHAVVHGVVDGKVLVEELLNVRATGQVMGDVTYGKLAVEVGGDISGAISGPEYKEHEDGSQHQRINGHASYSAVENRPDQQSGSPLPPVDRH